MNKPTKLFLANNDSILAEIINTIPDPNIDSTNNVFFDLMSCVLEQQIHYRSSKNIFKKMLDRASLKSLTPDNFSQFEERVLSNTKLSISKYETALRVVEFWKLNKIDWNDLLDDEIRGKLLKIKGIGNWTVDMILLFTLGRPNIFPYDDFHLKQIMIKLYALDPNSKLKAQMIDVSNRWGEQRSLAVKYLLAWKDLNKQNYEA